MDLSRKYNSVQWWWNFLFSQRRWSILWVDLFSWDGKRFLVWRKWLGRVSWGEDRERKWGRKEGFDL